MLISVELYGAGGVETHVLNLCELARSLNMEVTLVSRVARDTVPLLRFVEQLGIRHLTTPWARRGDALRLSQLWARAFWPFLLRRDYDVLYTFGIGRFTRFLQKFLAPSGRVIWHILGDPKHIPDIASTVSLGDVNIVVVESETHARAIREHLVTPADVEILPALALTAATERAQTRGVAGEARVSFLGRFDENKGVRWLIDAWPRLDIQPARLQFIGDGPLRPELEAAARSMSGEVFVRSGWTSAGELADILGETDLVVLPSASEGIPLVLMEAMSHGVPFAASDVGAIKDLAGGSADVRVAPRGAPLERAIEDLVRALRAKQIDQARLQRHYISRYDPAVVTSRWKSLLLGAHSESTARASTVECPA